MFTYSFSSSKFTFKSNPNKELPTENNMKLTLTTQCYLNYIFLYLQFTITNKHFFVISRSAFRRKPCADMRQKRHLCKLCPGRSSSDFVNPGVVRGTLKVRKSWTKIVRKNAYAEVQLAIAAGQCDGTDAGGRPGGGQRQHRGGALHRRESDPCNLTMIKT